jgi:peptidoglycan hydrolase-like protein with peptidoglycan-binding domain
MALSSPRFSRDRDLQLASQNRPPLEEGARGDGVKILQRALIDLDFDMPKSTTTGSPDGVYGLETKATVQAFQRDNGLTADGVAGQDTLNRLDQIFSALEEQQRLQEVADANTRGPLGKWLIT